MFRPIGRASGISMVYKALRRAKSNPSILSRARAERILSVGTAQSDQYSCAFIYSSSGTGVYQILQWLWAAEELDSGLKESGESGVVLVFRDAGAALLVSKRTALPVKYIRPTRELLLFLDADIDVAFYVNQATLNFQSLSAPRPAHVHLSHGESEKASMVSNNLKAYDYVFTAGPAARERIANSLIGFDVNRCIDIGRPQLDEPFTVPTSLPRTGKLTVVYAPTWEGDSPSMSYSSLEHSGTEIVSQLLALGYRVIYRPHPLTGSVSAETKAANRRICGLLLQAGPEHFVDRTDSFSWQPSISKAVVADVSAVAFDVIGRTVPVVIVKPLSSSAYIQSGGLLEKVATLSQQEVTVESALALACSDSQARLARSLADWYFGKTTQGSQIGRFIRAVQLVVAERKSALRLQADRFE